MSHKLLLFICILFYLQFQVIWFFLLAKTNTLGSDLSHIAVDAIAACSLLYSFYKSREKTRYFWLILALACASILIGDMIWMYQQLGIFIPFLSPDYFYACYLLLLLLAFAYKVTYSYNVTQRLLILCDTCITASVLLTLDYYVVFQTFLLGEQTASLMLFSQVVYASSDLLLLLLAIRILLLPITFSSKKVLWLLVFSLLLYSITDASYDLLFSSYPPEMLALIIPFYKVALLILALAGAVNKSTYTFPEGAELSFSIIHTIFPYIGIGFLCLLILVQSQLSNVLLLGLFITFLFVLLRQALVRHQNNVLIREMQQLTMSLEQRIAERTEELWANEQYFKSLYDYHPDPIFTLDLQGRWVSGNEAVFQLLGYKQEDFLQQRFWSWVHEEDLPTARAAFGTAKQGESVSLILRTYHKDSRIYHLHITLVPIVLHNQVIGLYTISKDITQQKQQQEEIQYLAFHDTLTGLLNRPSFMNELQLAIEEAKKTKTVFALLFIDLDRFKVINDTLGHTTGDLVLQEVARRLRHSMSGLSLPARLGGDEFTVLLRGNPSKQAAQQMVESILNTLQQPIFLGIHTIHITSSIGIAFYEEAGEEMIPLLQNADIAMYHSKLKGKNTFSFYNESMNKEMQRRLRLEKDLREALLKKELFLLYQPQFDLVTGRIIGLEALLRWQHQELGIISPAEFIPIAEDTGFIIPIGKWMLHEACQQMKKWEYLGVLRIAVNLSAKEFQQADIVQLIASILQETKLPPQQLNLELTERIAMENEKETLQKLKGLKELGVSISIDDFGTGYSSLAYLSLYPIDSLKIPRDLILLAESSREGLEILSVIASLAKALQMTVIVEGVETEAQLQLMYEHHFSYVQGYYFSAPLSAQEAEQLLRGSFLP